MLKCQFHSHSSDDPVDNIPYSPKELIDEAARLNYEVLAITCHTKYTFSEDLRSYAESKNILLIPAIEFEINNKHILGINIDKDIENVTTYRQLKEYKLTHPDCLIIAPHPYFPGKICLKNDLIAHIYLFDAIEYSFCYTTFINFNDKASLVGQTYRKPMVATADCHFIKDLNRGYTHVKSEKNIHSIIKAVKENKIKINTQPTTYKNIFRFVLGQTFRNFHKK
jgi:predicted metal-dependent phosphoesterase TrpH